MGYNYKDVEELSRFANQVKEKFLVTMQKEGLISENQLNMMIEEYSIVMSQKNTLGFLSRNARNWGDSPKDATRITIVKTTSLEDD